MNPNVDVPIARLRRPLERLIHLENISGVVLILGAVTAVVLANSPLRHSVDDFWHVHLRISAGPLSLDESLKHWVNDALMTIFFFVAGLEIKRELVTGSLADRRQALLPVFAAVGGMVVPALMYVAVSGPEARVGWGIPMATDIAFAIGVLTLLGPRVPAKLKVFLLTLAIVDDLGAIVVIAVFYSSTIDPIALGYAGIGLLMMGTMRSLGVWWMPAYIITGCAVWLATFESGVHATLAGVACGLMAPALPRRREGCAASVSPTSTIDELNGILFDTRETRSVADRLIHALHPWTALLVIPVFALANAGVDVSPSTLGAAAGSAGARAIAVGLLIGKPVGILLASWTAVRLGLASLPSGANWRHMAGVAYLGGIGFTVSLFITDLAFENPAMVATSKVAILSASVVAAVAGALLLRKTAAPPDELGPISYEELDATSPSPLIATRANGRSPVGLESATAPGVGER